MAAAIYQPLDLCTHQALKGPLNGALLRVNTLPKTVLPDGYMVSKRYQKRMINWLSVRARLMSSLCRQLV